MYSTRRNEGRPDIADSPFARIGWGRIARGCDGRVGWRRRGPRLCRLLSDRLALGVEPRLRQRLRTLFVDENVALLDGVITELPQRLGPALARLAATAGGVELGPIFESAGQRGVGRATKRHGLRHVLTGIAIGVEVDLRRRAHALALHLVVLEARLRR